MASNPLNPFDQTDPLSLQPKPQRGNQRSRSNSNQDQDRQHISKVYNGAYQKPQGGQVYGAPRDYGGHAGADYGMSRGTELYALVKSKVHFAGEWGGGQGKLVIIKSLEDRGPNGVIKKGDYFGYGHMSAISVAKDQEIEAGHVIGKSGAGSNNQPHLHFYKRRASDGPGNNGSVDPDPVVSYSFGGTVTPTNSSGSPDANTGTDGGGGNSAEQIAKAAAFSTILSFPSAVNSVESIALTGQRSMLNDEPLFPFIQQICEASLRSFMSMPDGKFYAFYPDYFGGFGRQPYWEIEDIEVISGRIDLSDDNLATHVFIVGDTQPGQSTFSYGSIDWMDKVNTTGVITLFNAMQTGFLNGPPSDTNGSQNVNKKTGKLDKDQTLRFLQKYGARRYYEAVPAVRSPIYETFLAFQKFCLLWAKQFETTFEFTFMPELFPGGIVAFPEHGIQCYVEEVSHSGSYEQGFTTVAKLSAPAALKNADQDPNREWIHSGMLRASVNDGNYGKPKGAYSGEGKGKSKKKKDAKKKDKKDSQ